MIVRNARREVDDLGACRARVSMLGGERHTRGEVPVDRPARRPAITDGNAAVRGGLEIGGVRETLHMAMGGRK